MSFYASFLRHHFGTYFEFLVQNEKPKHQLLENFKENKGRRSVLIATKSFFTGIDIKGAALSCLILDKLPFEVPSDPVIKALVQETGSFERYQLGTMIITLKQIFGRLIRAQTDTGVFVVGDARLASAPYRRKVFSSFGYEISGTRKINEVKDFFEKTCYLKNTVAP
jgi:ATP-dependent DNA helicase DinG